MTKISTRKHYQRCNGIDFKYHRTLIRDEMKVDMLGYAWFLYRLSENDLWDYVGMYDTQAETKDRIEEVSK